MSRGDRSRRSTCRAQGQRDALEFSTPRRTSGRCMRARYRGSETPWSSRRHAVQRRLEAGAIGCRGSETPWSSRRPARGILPSSAQGQRDALEFSTPRGRGATPASRAGAGAARRLRCLDEGWSRVVASVWGAGAARRLGVLDSPRTPAPRAGEVQGQRDALEFSTSSQGVGAGCAGRRRGSETPWSSRPPHRRELTSAPVGAQGQRDALEFSTPRRVAGARRGSGCRGSETPWSSRRELPCLFCLSPDGLQGQRDALEFSTGRNGRR